MVAFRWLWVSLWAICAAPAFAEPKQLVWLDARDGYGRPFQMEQMRGQVVAVTFASRYTRAEASRINDALANRDARVISVIDFTGIPSMFHRYAKRKVAEHDQPDRIRHLVDARGALRQLFGVDPVRRVDILLIDREGALRGRYCGETQLKEALKLLAELTTST